MKDGRRLMPVHGLSAAKHVKHDATAQVLDDTDPVNGLLHLAMPPVASFERIGGGGKEFFLRFRAR